MDNKTAHEKYVDEANLNQQKFTPFFIGLTFSILALSVENPISSGASTFSLTLELLGWIALLFSGLVGLRYFEWRQVLFANLAKWESRKNWTARIKDDQSLGHETIFIQDTKTDEPIDEVISDYEDAVSKSKAAVDGLEKSQTNYATIQRRTFYVGIISLVLARGWERWLLILGTFQ